MKNKLNKAIPFKIQKSKNHALLVQVDEGPYFYDQLHYHPEFQITAIIKGEGLFYAGNNMSDFTDTEVLMIGANVPHLLKNSIGVNQEVKGISLFFDDFSFGKHFFDINELSNIKSLLLDSNRVIKITGDLKAVINNKILSTVSLEKEQLIITFLEILSLIYQADKTYINEQQYQLLLNENEGGRLNEVLAYTFKQVKQEITIEQVAKIAYLSRSQFSSFFKLHTGKTYIQFLNELRIENACILLRNGNFTIEQICYEVGFQNVSNFVRQFKKVKNVTPSNYRKAWGVK